MNTNSLIKRKKAVITSFFVVFLLCSVSTVLPASQGNNTNKLMEIYNQNDLNKLEDDYKTCDDFINTLRKICLSEKILMVLPLINHLERLFNDNLGQEFVDQFPTFYNAAQNYYTNHETNMIDLLKKSSSLRRDVLTFSENVAGNIGEVSADDLLKKSVSPEAYLAIQNINTDNVGSFQKNTLKEDNFSIYKNQFDQAKQYWGRTTTFGGDSDSIDSWYINMVEFMLGLVVNEDGRFERELFSSFFITINAVLLIMIIILFVVGLKTTNYEIMAINSFLGPALALFDLFFLYKVYRGYLFATTLIQNQISFTVRVVDSNGTGIDNLESYYPEGKSNLDYRNLQGYIKIINVDAEQTADGKYFQYYLGPAFGKDEPGWYSVSTWNPSGYKYKDDPEDKIGYNWKYFKSPPAPGTYRIELANSTDGDLIVDGVKYNETMVTTDEIGFFGSYCHNITLETAPEE